MSIRMAASACQVEQVRWSAAGPRGARMVREVERGEDDMAVMRDSTGDTIATMPDWVNPITLEGHLTRLEPLETRHAPDLLAAADPELFRHTPQFPPEWSIAGFEQQIEKLNTLPDVVAFAIILKDTGKAIGRTTYMDIQPPSRGLEIGRTWIGRPWQGTKVNPEIKFLMLRHAFERLTPTAIRVQLTTSATNLHSQRAIAKLGAVREGVLRNHRIVPSGPTPDDPPMFRDTVFFSILPDEWPTVKARLIERIG
jgi:ribosomal-protein-alanine N-acetyltransferase